MILRKISFWIVEAVYPLIPSLYNIFQILAENRFFTQEQIAALSNNIYIFISVCMLFAFGIRLLNGIVNPDLLGEKKKGVKSVFFNAFAAVILIIIVPVGFRLMYSVQDNVMESHLIEKIFLGTELTEDQNPGQIIAAYAFSAFCYPNEEVSSSGLDSEGEDYYNKALSEDISYVKKLTGYINDGKGVGKNREYDLEYNSILAPAAGIVVLYELILMCMDLALRSVKLGLLQLIAPIILCGFIFKGTELLQKWFKEVITTWVLLFLKVAMVVFMIYGLALLPGFLDKIDFPDGSGKITKGLIKMFILIGLLQVIKQLPNIINSVFGTNIQSRGGIKGRLGEMAGIGQMAQQAWSGLGNKAKGIAGAAGGLAVGAAGSLARNGWQALKTGYNENYKGKNLKEKAATAGERMKNRGNKVWGGVKNTVGHPVETAKKVGASVKANGLDNIKKGAMTGLRGLATAGEVIKAGAGAGGFGAGVKAGKGLSNVKVPNVISDDNLTTSQTHATRRVSGLDEEKGTITKNTRGKFAEGADETARRIRQVDQDTTLTEAQKRAKREEIRYSGDTAKGYAKKAVEAESGILSDNHQKVTSDHIYATGKTTELEKADDAKNAMASILSQMGSSMSMMPGVDGSWATNMAQAIQDKAGTFNLNNVMSETLNNLSPDLQGQFKESLKTLQNNQDMFLNCQTSLQTNFDGVNIGTSKDLNSQMTSAKIQANNAETLFNSVRDSSSEAEKVAMNRAVTAGNTLFAMIPEYAQYSDSIARGDGLVQFIPTTPNSIGEYVTDGVFDVSPKTSERNLNIPSGGGQPTQQPISGGGGSQGSQQNPQYDDPRRDSQDAGPGSQQRTAASNPEHQQDGSYTPGIYGGGTVNASVDLSGLEQRLDQINNSVNSSGQNVTKAVNSQGSNISNKLTEANTHLKRIDTGIGNMGSSIGNLGSSMDDLNKKDDDE